MGYQWYWGIIFQYKIALAKGVLITLWLSTLIIATGTVLGIIFALMRRSEHPFVKYPTVFATEILRDLPILVILVWLYYVLPVFGLIISGFMAAYVGFSLTTAAFVSEAIRAGIESVPKGQLESAIVMGYNKLQAMTRIILPQAYKRILPNLMNLYINQIKLTALASVIAVNELLHIANILISSTYRPLEIYTAVAALYLIVIVPLAGIAYLIERKLGIKAKTV
jgi:polar amino acid transport system permease protein